MCDFCHRFVLDSASLGISIEWALVATTTAQLRRLWFSVDGRHSGVVVALDRVGLSIWIAQAIVLVIGAGLSYAGQKWFTFKVNHHVDCTYLPLWVRLVGRFYCFQEVGKVRTSGN